MKIEIAFLLSQYPKMKNKNSGYNKNYPVWAKFHFKFSRY